MYYRKEHFIVIYYHRNSLLKVNQSIKSNIIFIFQKILIEDVWIYKHTWWWLKSFEDYIHKLFCTEKRDIFNKINECLSINYFFKFQTVIVFNLSYKSSNVTVRCNGSVRFNPTVLACRSFCSRYNLFSPNSCHTTSTM